MLVLTRRFNDAVVISHPDGDITIKIVGFGGGPRVQLGIDAPQSVLIRRSEMTGYAR